MITWSSGNRSTILLVNYLVRTTIIGRCSIHIAKRGPINGSLADDLAGIYCDLRPGLDAWGASDAATRTAIVWDWRITYESHWGHHVIDAMRAIHALLHTHSILDTDAIWPPALDR